MTCPATRYPFRLSQGVFSEKTSLTENAPTLLVPVHTYTHSIDLPTQLNAENCVINKEYVKLFKYQVFGILDEFSFLLSHKYHSIKSRFK